MQIYFFSGTGNSLHIARELGKRFPDASLVPIMGALKEEKPKTRADVVGLVFPIHAFTLPWPVRTFLEKADFRSASYIFAVASRECFAKVFDDIDGLLKKQGKRLDAGFSFEMPQNYIPVFNVYSPDEQSRVEAAMLKGLDRVVQTVTAKQTHRPKDPLWISPLSRGIMPLVSLWFRNVRFPDMARSFYTNEQCSECGICEQVCLSNKIQMKDGRPVWDESVQCTYCFACLHYCPEAAIQLRGRRTVSKSRYHQPSVKAADIAAQKR
jgi:Pyruvate/2-oxoacid:ferredoxin oxidoreductase delta subunit